MPFQGVHQKRSVDSDKHQSSHLQQRDMYVVQLTHVEIPWHTSESVLKTFVWQHHHPVNPVPPHHGGTVEAQLFLGRAMM